MKATAPVLIGTAQAEKSGLAVLSELTKIRLTSLVLLTTVVGFLLASAGAVDYPLLWSTLCGTALVAAGASALNQWLEREPDSKMRRTRDRPLPSGRLQPATVLWFGVASAGLGLLWLALAVHLTTAALGALSLVIYLFIYTPLKQVTWLNTAVGAVSGGLPPLMGWTAARGQLTEGWVLFAILAIWQFPHFMAIAWLYRDEYAKAGFQMLPVIDARGRRTGRLAAGTAALLLPVSLLPSHLNLAGPAYAVGAILLGLAFLWFAVQFARQSSVVRARRLFYASLVYLPALLALLVWDKTA